MTDEEEPEKMAPIQCGSCGHWYYAPLEPVETKCPRCGYCVECV